MLTSSRILEGIGIVLLTAASTLLVVNIYPAVINHQLLIALFLVSAIFITVAYYKLEWGVAALIVALPLDGIRVAGPLRLTEIISLGLVIGFLLRIVIARDRVILPPGQIFVVLTLFLVANALSTINAIEPLVSVKRLAILSYLVVTSYVIGQVLANKDHRQLLVKVFVVSLIGFSLYGIYQFVSPEYRELSLANAWNVSGLPRITWFYGDPNLLSGLIAVGVLLCLSLISHGEKLGFKAWVLPTTAVLLLANLLLTFSRSGAVALIAGVAALVLAHYRVRYLYILAAFVTLSVFVLGSIYVLSPTVQTAVRPAVERLTRLTDSSVESVGARIVAYRQAVSMTVDHPLLGVGPDMFPYEYDRRTGITAPEAHVVAHNLALETVAEKGILGLSVLAFLFWTLFYRAKQIATTHISTLDRALGHWLVASLLSFLVLTIFLTGLNEIYLWVLFSFVYALTEKKYEPNT